MASSEREQVMSTDYRDGVLLVDKDAGGTSHDVVQRARRILRQKKIGHCGTLDPSATGLLVLTVGKATRLTRFLIRAPKVYEGEVRFGITTDTYDGAGEVTAEKPVGELAAEAIDDAMAGFEGAIDQTAPPYSAKKVGGVKHYELARKGEEVPDVVKTVEVHEFRRTHGPEEDRIRFRLGCGSGTYARTLAHDLGTEMGCGAHLSALRRTSVGPFQVAQAKTLAQLQEALDAGEGLGAAWVAFDEIPLPFQEVSTDPQQEERIVHGQTILVRQLAGEEGDWIQLKNRRGQFIAVGTISERIGQAGVGIVQPKVVFKQ